MAAERFRLWILFTGQSQDQIAERLGCSQSLVSAVTRGHRRPGVDLIHAIERATASWPDGPIRTEEWESAPEASEAPTDAPEAA